VTLSHRDVRAVGEFLTRCYGVPDVDGYAQQVLTGIAKLVPSAHSSFNLFDQRRRRITWVEHPHEADRFQGAEEVLSTHFHEHPAVRHFLANPADRAFVKISDFMTGREFGVTAIYNEYYRKRGIRHQMSIMLPGQGGLRIAIALNRDGRDFSERDRQILNLLPRHLLAAHRTAAAFGAVAGTLALLERGLDVAKIGLVVLGAGTEPILITAGASRLLDAYFGKRGGRGLQDPVVRWLARLDPTGVDELLAVASPLVAGKGKRRLSIRLRFDGDRRVLLFEEHLQESPLEPLIRLGLSPREAQVLRWVAAGKTNDEIATILGLSGHTVHHHVEHVYRKLGVENRTTAARIAIEAAESWPPPGGTLR
jgi:DNA-binding CsgD family transcriptional regulator